MTKKSRGATTRLNDTMQNPMHDHDMVGVSNYGPHQRNLVNTSTHSPKKVRDSWSNMPAQRLNQGSVFYSNPQRESFGTPDEVEHQAENFRRDHVSFGVPKASTKPGTT